VGTIAYDSLSVHVNRDETERHVFSTLGWGGLEAPVLPLCCWCQWHWVVLCRIFSFADHLPTVPLNDSTIATKVKIIQSSPLREICKVDTTIRE
jgi:hypothetical protein